MYFESTFPTKNYLHFLSVIWLEISISVQVVYCFSGIQLFKYPFYYNFFRDWKRPVFCKYARYWQGRVKEYCDYKIFMKWGFIIIMRGKKAKPNYYYYVYTMKKTWLEFICSFMRVREGEREKQIEIEQLSIGKMVPKS